MSEQFQYIITTERIDLSFDRKTSHYIIEMQADVQLTRSDLDALCEAWRKWKEANK